MEAGGGVGDYPDSQTMQIKAKEWYDKYDAELISLAHDTLTFSCSRLSKEEAGNIIEDAKMLHAEIIDCEPEGLLEHLMEERKFTLWWD